MPVFHQPEPPSLPRKFLQWFCKSELLEMIEGDLEEEYRINLDNNGKWKANLYYCIDVLGFLRPFAIKQLGKNNISFMGMNINYLKVAVRGFKNDKLNSALSIFGLLISFTCAMVIYAVVNYQLDYDQFHLKSERIYRVNYDETLNPNSQRIIATVGPPLGPAIKEFYPEVEDAVRFRGTPEQIIKYKNRQFYESQLFFADPGIFNVFTYPLLKGNPDKALTEKNSIVMTEEMAVKYFGEEDPIGKIVSIANESLVVTGVLKSIPKNTTLPIDFIRPFEAFEVPFGYPVNLNDWGWVSFQTYILLKHETDYLSFEEKLTDFAKTHFDEEKVKSFRYRIQPLSDIYFGGLADRSNVIGSLPYVYILTSVGILIFMLAIFNFTNIQMAKSFTRSKETGIRKAIGSSVSSLWLRFLFEPVIISLAAFIFAIFMVPECLGLVKQYLNFDYTINSNLWKGLLSVFLPVAFLTGFLSGIYPAFILSTYKHNMFLKNRSSNSKGGEILRKSLITVQFVITSALLIGSFIINAQVDFMLNKDLGFNKNEVALLKIPGEVLSKHYKTLRNEFINNPFVTGASIAGGRMNGPTGGGPIHAEGIEEPIPMDINAIGEDFFSTIGVQLLAGHEFSSSYAYDSADGIIINERVAQTFDWTPEEAIGKAMKVSNQREGHIIGVVENFNYQSLHDAITPLVFIYPHTLLTEIYLGIKPSKTHDLVISIENSWKNVLPDTPFDFSFANDQINTMYKSDIQFSSLIKLFSWITIFIAVIGLYGIINLVCRFRMKEIGIRKVIGASVNSLIMTISKSFIGVIIIANMIAWPLVYWFANGWLSSFAYKIVISPWYFILGLGITVLVAAFTLVFQTSKAALSNPVKVLKQE